MCHENGLILRGEISRKKYFHDAMNLARQCEAKRVRKNKKKAENKFCFFDFFLNLM